MFNVHIGKQFLHSRKQIHGQDWQDPIKVVREHIKAYVRRISLGMKKKQELREENWQ